MKIRMQLMEGFLIDIPVVDRGKAKTICGITCTQNKYEVSIVVAILRIP